jgi:beta-glucosidase
MLSAADGDWRRLLNVGEQGDIMSIHFPDGFLWGATTAAYQIEGAAREGGRGASIWDTFARIPGKTRHGDNGDIAIDHYHRLESDLDLMVELGLKAYRFSVSWSRILPSGIGKVNQRGLDFYQRLVDGLCKRGIIPMLTLYQWDLPQALQDRGGWLQRDTADWLADYSTIVYRALSDRVPYWVTLNEPQCSAFVGHAQGLHAPGLRDEAAALAATHHLLLGHGKTVQALHAEGVKQNIGITLNLAATRPATASLVDQAAAWRLDGIENRLFLDPIFCGRYPEDIIEHYRPISDFSFVADGDLESIAEAIDFLGVNYYLRHIVQADPTDPQRSLTLLPPTGKVTDWGLGFDPDGLTELLVRLKKEYTQLPLYITENGAAFYDYVNPEGQVDDEERIDYLDVHFRGLHQAITQGVDLRGYFVWSLFDNFEWADGYAKRYGIVYVDFGSQVRIPKQSALWYRNVIRHNGLL